MRRIVFILSVFIVNSVFGQDIIRKEIMSFYSSEKRSKSVKVFLVASKYSRSLIFEAYNVKNMDVQSCSWKTKISLESAFILIEELNSSISLDKKTSDDFSWLNKEYIIKSKKRKRVNITFLNSKCNREHKVGLFQKNCNKDFSFIFDRDKVIDFIEKLSIVLNSEDSIL